MPDIRSFFAPKNGGTFTSKAKPPPTPAPKKTTAKKRRTIVDSDDDEEEEPLKKTPAKSSAVKPKPVPKPEPVEEKTTSTSYFSSTGKNRVTRSAPVRESRPKKTIQIDDDEDEATNDVFEEKFKKNDDDYQEEPDADEDEDMDDFVVPDEEEDIKPKKKIQATKVTSGNTIKSKPAPKKRKIDLTESEEEDEKPVKKKTPAKKAPAPKKPRTPAVKKTDAPVNSATQKIIDSIPLIDAPEPPKTEDGSVKKPNFYAARAARAAAETSVGEPLDMPTGAENCLAGLTFVFTGVTEGLSREDGQQLVKKHGGKVMTAPSSKTSFVVLGTDAGPKKLDTIKKFNLKTIGIEGLFQLIKTLPPNGGDGNAAQAHAEKLRKEEEKVRQQVKEMEEQEREAAKKAKEKAKIDLARGVTTSISASSTSSPSSQPTAPLSAAELWTVKYAPNSLSQICGNKSQVEKLGKWLREWPKNLKANFQKRGADGSGGYRAVMIHGPPGIGKTTAAHLVAKLEGYDILEYNASDTRSKKQMEDTMRGVLDNTSITGYFAPDGQKVESGKKKLVLIMDEVDGMSAGDRGGVGQLAALCRKTSVPIICICNERKLPKMKPFDNVTMDMAFRRPDAAMIRSRIMSIAFKEKLKLPPTAIDALVEGTRSDIRQIVNMLSTYTTTEASMSYDQGKDFAKQWEKHVVFKPWDIASKLLGYEMFGKSSRKTLNEKMELYFNDHEFSYLMVQENYMKVNPEGANGLTGKAQRMKLLELMDNAASSISDGDLCDALIHGPQSHWSLMPTHGMLSTIIPASNMHGSFTGGGYGGPISFTSWLGNNSKQNKLGRFVKEIQSHIRLRTSGDRHEVRQQYLPLFHQKLVRRLESEGKDSLDDIIDTMDEYFLTKDDWDAIVELGVGPMGEATVSIPTQTRSAFTRTYNQRSHPMPFMKASSVAATKAAKKDVPDIEDAIIESEDEALGEPVEDEDEEMDISKDKYIKQPKKTAAKKTTGGEKAATKKKAPAKPKAPAKKK